MPGCLTEDDLLDLASSARALRDAPTVEAHLAACASCSALLSTLIESAAGESDEAWGGLVGRSLGPYRLEAQIGAGASGAVYRAWDERLARRVAVKVLAARVAGSAEQIRRLATEGRAAAALTHPNVITIFDTGSVEGLPFIVSELYEGESLRSLIARRALPRSRAIALGVELARGLAAAHEQGVVHRDLKPENLLVIRDGTLKILDFGLAKLIGVSSRPDLDATLPGTVLGTLGYLSPEQARGEPADARSDLFAAGAVLYEMLCGERAFVGATVAERLSSVLRDAPPGLDDARLGDARPAVARCLEKDPHRRFQPALDLAWALERLLDPATSRRSLSRPGASFAVPRRNFLIAAAAAVGLGGVALGRALGRSRPPSTTLVSPSYQQLTYRHGRVPAARFTRDGGSVIYAAAWDGQPLAVAAIRLGGGGTRGEVRRGPGERSERLGSARHERRQHLARGGVRAAVAPPTAGQPQPRRVRLGELPRERLLQKVELGRVPSAQRRDGARPQRRRIRQLHRLIPNDPDHGVRQGAAVRLRHEDATSVELQRPDVQAGGIAHRREVTGHGLVQLVQLRAQEEGRGSPQRDLEGPQAERVPAGGGADLRDPAPQPVQRGVRAGDQGEAALPLGRVRGREQDLPGDRDEAPGPRDDAIRGVAGAGIGDRGSGIGDRGGA